MDESSFTDNRNFLHLKGTLIGALIGLSRALEGKNPTENSDRLLLLGLSAASAGYPLKAKLQEELLTLIHREKAVVAPDCAVCQSPCGRTSDYDMAELRNADQALLSSKFLLLNALCSIGTLAYYGSLSGTCKKETLRFLYDGLFMLGCAYEAGQLESLLARSGRIVREISLPLADKPESMI